MKARKIGQGKKRGGKNAGRLGRWAAEASGLWGDLRKTGLTRLIFFFLILVLCGAALIFFLEIGQGNGAFTSFADGLWWSIVTIATVGYGDKVPSSRAGQAAAMVFILAGFFFTALISGTVASIFVERRIREGKGLRELSLKGHVLICGWNRNAIRVIEGLLHPREGKSTALVLVNEREGDWFEGLKADYPGMDLRYVRGDFSNEVVLRRANIGQAKAAVILPDESGGSGLANADERGILAALTIAAINPEIALSAEILKEESEAHMRRAGVGSIILNGEFSAFLLSAACSNKGVPEAARRLLSSETASGMRQAKIPPSLVGKTFLEATEHFMKNGKGLLIGVLSEEKAVSLEAMMSSDSSAIDDFIKRKFRESSIDISSAEYCGAEIKINPGAEYRIRDNDQAFVVG